MSKTSQTTSGTPTVGDVVIAVMGVTGVGKSTFINYFSDGEAVVGHSLEACTRGVEIHPSTLRDGTKLYLVDTPGFDDTYRSDTDILKEIANWLSSAYENNFKLAGIVYLQRIEDTRLGGAAMKNLRMFKKLCGDNSLASVVLATTRWRHDEMEEGIRKEKELCTNAKMWKRMIDFGSKVMRQDRDEHSAGEILQYLIQRKKPVTLDIQLELVDNNKTLNETGAGQELHAELEKQKANYEKQLRELREEMSETITKMNADLKAQLQEEKEELERRLREAQEHDRELEVTREEMRQQMAREAQRERDELMEERRQAEREVLTSQFVLRELQQENVKQLNELKFAVELQQKKDENEILRQLLKAEEESRCVLM